MTALDNVTSAIPSQTAGSSPILADDWNNYVKAGLTSLAGGHLICSSGQMSGAALSAGMMFFDTGTNQLKLYNGSSWVVLFDISASTSAAFPVSTPVGMISPFAGGAAPTGWLLCDGSLQPTSNYTALYAVIGTTYGSGSGTFGLPDLRGRAAFGKDNMSNGSAGTANRITTAASNISGTTLGAAGGSQYIPIHTHTDSFAMPNHTHTTAVSPNIQAMSTTQGASGTNIRTALPSDSTISRVTDTGYNKSYTSGNPSTTTMVGSVGNPNGPSGQYQSSGTNYANMPPGMILNYIIKY